VRVLGTSALAKSFHTLLAKSIQSPRLPGGAFAGLRCPFLPAGKSRGGTGAALRQQIDFTDVRINSRKQSVLHAGGADDGAARHTPSAWMISRAFFLAPRQILFSVWVTFDEHKWSILAERRS
jgi:hypothetical protein